MVSFNIQPLTTLMLVLTFFFLPDSLSGSTDSQSPCAFLFLLCFSLVLSHAALVACHRERCSFSSGSLPGSISSQLPRTLFFLLSASRLEHFVAVHLGRLAFDSLRVSAGHFLFGIMKQLFSKIYRTHLKCSMHSTPKSSPRKSNEMLYKCTEEHMNMLKSRHVHVGLAWTIATCRL